MSFTTRIKFLNNNNNSKKKKDSEMTQLKKASPMATNNSNNNNNNQPNDENPCDDVNEKYVDIDGIKFKITESEDDEGEEDGAGGGGGGGGGGDGDGDGDQNNEDANSTTSSSHEVQKIKRRKPNQDVAKNNKKTTQKPKKDQKQQQDKQDKSKNELMLKVNKRKVSLLKFDPNTALYPVCRAWMVNEQESKYIDLDYLFTQYVKRPENGLKMLKALIDDDISCISLMPAPISQLIEINGACLESRIPNAEILSNQEQQHQQHQSKKNILDDIIKRLEKNDTEDCPSTVGLLREHLQRWKSVKVNWKKHTRAYDEERYGVNFAILDTMFKLQMRKNN